MSRTPREHSLAHAGFTLAREFPSPITEVWSAFAIESRKKQWFGEDPSWEIGEWRFDFRVGGRDVAEGSFHDGPHSRYVAEYTSIVEHERIVTTYNMWFNGTHISTSLATYEFEPMDSGTRLTHTEHGVHLDGFDTGEQREHGTVELLESLRSFLAGER